MISGIFSAKMKKNGAKSIKMKKSIIKYGCLLTVLAAYSCNTRYLKEGQLLYTGAKLKIENDTMSKKAKSELKEGLEKNITPKPNSSFLGLRPRLWIYNITPAPKKPKGITNWLKNTVGEKPVLLGDVDREFNRKVIINYSENKGYFNAGASYDTIVHNRKARVIYHVKPGARYLISKVTFPADSTLLNREMQAVKGETFLKAGNPFDLDVIKAERERIDTRLKERGFYYFHPDNLIVQADSTVSKNQKVDLLVRVKANTPALATQQFTIDKVVVFSDYSIADARDRNYVIPYNTDSLKVYNGMYVVDPEHKFKPKIFDRAMYFKRGDLYNRADHNLTLNRLVSLGVFKFVKNEFLISDSLQHKFDAYYLLTPRPFQSLRLETTGRSNSANYVGSEVNLNWTHRNLFKGAEQLKVAAFGSFDVQVGGPKTDKGTGNIIRAGANAQLSIPSIVAPFRFRSSSAFVPRTNMTLGYEFQNRTKWYTLQNFNASFGYNWKENMRKEHDLKLIDVTLVKPSKVTAEYDSLSRDTPYLQRVVEKQLIFGPRYSYTYTNTMLPKTNTVYYRGQVDLAGTLAGLFTGADAKGGDQKEIAGIPFSQFAKMEHDFRFYHKLSDKNTIAARAIAGIAYPYGNSVYVPFARQFFVGGSNSIRAFRARTLGPGSYDPRSQKSLYLDQAGDIKLELNAEYRANLYRFLNAAVFADAGNIWLVNEDPARPGGKFTKNWIKEIAIGAGVGLRLDFNILILRLDLAMPLRVPYLQEGSRWTAGNIDFGNRDWRRENLMLNIAIGYPF